METACKLVPRGTIRSSRRWISWRRFPRKLGTQHIPAKGSHLIRYYGWYSNKSRGMRKKGKGAKMLCVNVYWEDLEIHAARMKADPDKTRDLMGRHRAVTEGIVNNLMNHQDVRHAQWKGLALARLQVGLAIAMLNTLKWYKIRHAQLKPMTLTTAA